MKYLSQKKWRVAVAVLLCAILCVGILAGYEPAPAKAAAPVDNTIGFKNQFIAECLARVGQKYESAGGHYDNTSNRLSYMGESFDCTGLVCSAF